MALKNSISLSGGARRRQMPSKRTINLASLGEKPMNMAIAVPAVVLIVVAAVLFSKFLVIDRLAEVAAAQRQVAELRAQLDAGYEELAGFDELNELYAHYTYSGMTQEELTRTDRAEVLDLIQRVVIPRVELGEWSLTGNQLSLSVTGVSLQDINLLVQELEEDGLVNYCSVTTAVRNDYVWVNGELIDDDDVNARVVVYLNSEAEVPAE